MDRGQQRYCLQRFKYALYFETADSMIPSCNRVTGEPVSWTMGRLVFAAFCQLQRNMERTLPQQGFNQIPPAKCREIELKFRELWGNENLRNFVLWRNTTNLFCRIPISAKKYKKELVTHVVVVYQCTISNVMVPLGEGG